MINEKSFILPVLIHDIIKFVYLWINLGTFKVVIHLNFIILDNKIIT